MKKLIAIVLALLMIAAAAASAEGTFTFADPVITINMGESQTIDLTGFEVGLVGGTAGDVVAAQINLSGDGNKLLTVNLNIVGSKILLGIEGVSKTFYAELPEQLSSMSSMDLSGLNIDMEALGSILANSIELDGDTIRIPYTAVNEALELIAPAIESVEIPGADFSGFSSSVAQLKESNSGITLEGSFAQTDDKLSVSAAIIPVMNGQAGESVANLGFDYDAAGLTVKIDVPGKLNGYFSAQPAEDSKVKISVGGEAEGKSFDLTGVASYGETDAELVLLDEASAIDVATLAESDDQALLFELMGAIGGLYQYFTGALGAAA